MNYFHKVVGLCLYELSRISSPFRKYHNVSLKVYNLFHGYYYTFSRYIAHATYIKLALSQQQLEYRILAHIHVIEKGLSLPKPKARFGEPIVLATLNLLREYQRRCYPLNNFIYTQAVAVIRSYILSQGTRVVSEADITSLTQKVKHQEKSPPGGVLTYTREQLLLASMGDFKSVALNRFSLRQFSEDEIDVNMVNEAVKIAQKSPSVCNRQATKIYYLREPWCQKALSLHEGNRGFGHLVHNLLIVTADLRAYTTVGERYQAYLDGGLFAMSLLYALEYKGLGACSLNWNVEPAVDRRFRKEIPIADNDEIIMMIAVGKMPEKVSVAASSRRPLEEILVHLEE